VSLEAPFWEMLKEAARERGISVNKLLSEIDRQRPPDANLSSAARVYLLEAARRRASSP
jgi:predicted DNA-binding ribbon-helix-helix protein